MNRQERALAAGAFSLRSPQPQQGMGSQTVQGSTRGWLGQAGARAADGLSSRPRSPASARAWLRL